ncbi:MAG: acetyl-CoA C-acetyltransferase [Bdellovibrio sp.]|nr:MAG: acetyl-CoA C-acetyltransferase [Bdellovibrio sp.]
MSTAYILSAQRTPIGSFLGGLSSVPAPRLGATAIQSAVKAASLEPTDIQECIMGEVLTAGVGQAPARQAAIYAGLPSSTPCMTINKVCGSGLKAVMLATDSILLGNSDVVVAGGQENMSLAPHLLEKSRNGYKMGTVELTDSMIKDGLWDPYNQFHMGVAAELCVKEYKFSREEQDEFAKQSYLWAQEAQKKGLFKEEITPVEVKTRKATLTVEEDEEPQRAHFEKMKTLKPAFDKEGTVTAANASKLNDGAAALVLASESFVQQKGCKPLAKIIAYSTFAQDPQWFTTAPIGAIKKVLQKTQLQMDQIDLFEINEAFSAVTMATMKELQIPREKINVNGGAVALGHPIGASGARILTTLLYALKQRDKKRGLATLCIGGGEAVALIVERLS